MQAQPRALTIWLLAARPKTLPAAATPVIVGTAVAAAEDAFRLGPALAALGVALLLQIGTNLANDVFDFQRGADAGGRLGPLRVTQAGLRSPVQVKVAMTVVFGLAGAIGLYLALVAGWPVVIVGLLAILSAVAYTGGPFPLGYHGLGDLFVFIFFGLVAVCGTYYVQAGRVSVLAWWSAVPIGLLATAILVVNNLRDIESDRAAGKGTLAVRLGQRGARAMYLLLLRTAFLLPAVMWAAGVAGPSILLTWLTFVVARPTVTLVLQREGRILNQALAGTARIELVYGALLSLGVLLGRWI